MARVMVAHWDSHPYVIPSLGVWAGLTGSLVIIRDVPAGFLRLASILDVLGFSPSRITTWDVVRTHKQPRKRARW